MSLIKMSISAATLGLRLIRRPASFSASLSSPCSAYNSAFAPIRASSILRTPTVRSTFARYKSSGKKAPANTRNIAKPAAATSKAVSSPPQPPARYWSLEENLARAGHETVLYQSGSRLLVYIYYSLSVASISWAGWEFYENVINVPDDVPQWTRAVSSLGAGMGLVIFAYCFWVPSRLIHRIIAIPRANSSPPSIALQIQARSLVPFRRRIIDASPKTTYLTTPFYQPPAEAAKSQFSGYLGPLKFLGWAVMQGSKRLIRALRLKDFAGMKVEKSGVLYRIDREGWVWEREKKGLDMLLKQEGRVYPISRGG